MGLLKRLNPLRGLFETTTYPHARTLRSSLLTKFQDTIHFFAGTYFFKGESKKTLWGNKRHFGIYDYATFFIPYFCYKLWLQLFEKQKNILVTVVYFLTSLVL